MRIKNIFRFSISILVFQFFLLKSFSQISITGPTCVQAGVSYQYTISGSWTQSTSMSWSVSGGTITNPPSSGTPKPNVFITWTTNGTVSLVTSNPAGNASKSVSVSATLSGGTLSNTSQTITYNATPNTINSSTPASGGNCSPSYSYQWQQSTDNVNFSDISGQTSLSLTFSAPLTITTYYRRKVTETVSGSVAYSNSATVTVMPQLYPNTVMPGTQDIFIGTDASNLSIPPASGGNCSGNYIYSWEFSSDNISFGPSGLGTANGLVPGSPNSTIYYRRKVVCGTESQYSNAAAIFVHAHLSAGNISSGSITITYNTSPGLLTATASGGICASYSYQWFQSADNINWTPISGATASSYNPGNLTSRQYYKLQVVCGSETVNSPVVTITVAPQLQIGTLSGGISPITYNTNPGYFIVTGTAGGNCSGVYLYQWKQSTDNINFSDISGATASNYNPGTLTVTTYFKASVTCGSESGITNTSTITVTPQLIAGTLTSPVSSSSITYNTNPGTITGTAATGGGCPGSYSYQWESSTDNTTFSSISGATALNYAPGVMTTTKYFRRKVTCGSETIYSNTVTINVAPALVAGGINPSSLSIPYNTSPGTVTSSSASGGNTGSYAYQWQVSTDNVTFNNIAGATSLTYTPGNLTITTYYKVKVTRGTETAYSPVTVISVAGSTCTDMNYVKVRDITRPLVTDSTTAGQLTNLGQVKQTTQYFDGLGRVVQVVVKKGSLVTNQTATDLVSPVLYDPFGREAYKLLPYASPASDGNYRCNAITEQSSFNVSRYTDEQYYFGMSAFEASPLNRPAVNYAPGNNWVGASRGIQTKAWINTALDSVRIWNVTDVANTFGTYATSGMYAAGLLSKNASTDENGKQVIEFNDKEGKLILKKVQLITTADNGAGKGHWGWLCTYYIYDDFNQLRCVVQPRGVELLIAASWAFNSTILNDQTFRYEYDGRQRMIMKKMPGVGIVYMIYDARDRLVMTQDSLMRAAHKWLYTIYDVRNRPTTTGLITDNTNYNNAPFHRGQAATSIPYPNVASFPDEQLTKTFYDDYSWRSGEGNPLKATRSTTNDTYLFAASNSTWPYPEAVNQSALLRGLVTGTKTKVVGSAGTYLYTVSFYDDKARTVQLQSTNITGDSTIVTTQYSFTNQKLFTITREGKAGNNSQTSIALTQISYDSIGRVLKTEKKISNSKVNTGAMPSTWKTIAQNEYEALGLLKRKKLGLSLDSLTYDYNIRGWMLGANRSYVKDTTSTANWFGFDLGYDKTSFTVNGGNHSYTAAQYNGNIEGMLWRSTGDDYLRKYDFAYDAANRLLSADFNQLNSNVFSKAALIDFSVRGITYDANGNILTMNQSGWKLGGSVTIDSLLYTYAANTNRLLNLLDRKNDTATKLGDFRSSKAYMTALSNNKTTAAADYAYNANGNLIVDKNKDISSITYNYLNLPDSIRITSKGTIKYTYDAAGNKLIKVTRDSTVTPVKITTTLYMLANFVNDTLQFLPQEEGRVRFDSSKTSLVYDYFLRDHLGNVRMILTDEKDTSFYPPASLETANLATERLFYSKVDSGRVDKSTVTGYPTDPYTNPNNFIQKLNGNGVKVGTGIVLKVMTGDKFNLRVSSWWSSGNTPGAPVNPLNDVVAALAGSVGNIPGKPSSTELITSGILPPNATNFLNSESGYVTSRPKAFINWILFDERFNYVANSSGFEQVGSSGVFTTHTRSNLTLNKSGYLYVYVSNETPNIDVLFDNLQVTHIRGLLTEETHYYPFGLTMAGISSKALSFGDPGNRTKYNGIEYDSIFAVDEYEAQLRNLDPQLGRWWQIDAKIEDMKMWNPYASNYDNPILYSDPLGDEPECCKDLWDEVKSAAKETWISISDGYVAVARWTNDNLNPLATAAELVTGKTVNSNFTESKPRGESAVQLMSFVNPEAKGESIAAKIVANDLAKTEIKSTVQKYEVNTAENLAKNSVKEDKLDIHHVPQSQPAKNVIEGYDKAKAPAIALPQAEHKAIPTLKGTTTAGNARQQLAKDIRDLRNHTNAPNSSLQRLIDLNKQMYPILKKK